MVRLYAQYMGLAILVIGIAGVLLGERSLLNLVNIDILEDAVHLVTGGLLAYVGFANRDLDLVKSVVGGISVMYLIVGVLGFITPNLLGLLPHGYSGFDNVLHLGIGGIGIALAWFMSESSRHYQVASTSPGKETPESGI